MKNSRRLVIGLALFLSISWSGSAQETPPQEEAPLEKDPWAVLQSTPGVLTDRINVDGSDGCGCTVLDRELDLGTGRAAAADETLASRTLRLVVKMWWND